MGLRLTKRDRKLLKNLLCLLKKPVARISYVELSGRALQQFCLQVTFKLRYLFAHCRLAYREASGSS